MQTCSSQMLSMIEVLINNQIQENLNS